MQPRCASLDTCPFLLDFLCFSLHPSISSLSLPFLFSHHPLLANWSLLIIRVLPWNTGKAWENALLCYFSILFVLISTQTNLLTLFSHSEIHGGVYLTEESVRNDTPDVWVKNWLELKANGIQWNYANQTMCIMPKIAQSVCNLYCLCGIFGRWSGLLQSEMLYWDNIGQYRVQQCLEVFSH